jgi:hypothetical protein
MVSSSALTKSVKLNDSIISVVSNKYVHYSITFFIDQSRDRHLGKPQNLSRRIRLPSLGMHMFKKCVSANYPLSG